MPNPQGTNQLGSSHVPYGEAKRMKQLAGEAPMSGAPIATSALQAPTRARRKPQPQPVVEHPTPVHADYQQMPALPAQASFASIAQIPGASPLVQEIFGSQNLPPR